MIKVSKLTYKCEVLFLIFFTSFSEVYLTSPVFLVFNVVLCFVCLRLVYVCAQCCQCLVWFVHSSLSHQFSLTLLISTHWMDRYHSRNPYRVTTLHQKIKWRTKNTTYYQRSLRNRPFNLKSFLFRSEFFFRTTRVRIFIFFVGQSAKFFFQDSTLGYMTKTLNQIIFFFLHQNQNIFLEKKHNPPPSS